MSGNRRVEVAAPVIEAHRPDPVQAQRSPESEPGGNLQLLQMRRGGPSRTGDPNGNLAMQRNAAVHEAARHGTSGAGTALPHLDQIQRSFGRHDVRHVQAHMGADAREAARDMGANAFTTGDHVAFGQTPDASTAAHEAAHVVQQRGGVQLQGGVGEAGDRYEHHADEVAALVVQGRSAEALLDKHAGGGTGGVQHQCASCPVGHPCECAAVQRDQPKYGIIPDPNPAPAVGPGTKKATKTFKNGWTFSADPEFTRNQLIAMWKGTDRKTVKDFVDNCDADDPELQKINEQLEPGWKGVDNNGAPPLAPSIKPVYDKPPPTPADLEKSGQMGDFMIYHRIRWEFRSLDSTRATFERTFQQTAKSRLELIMETSKKQVEAEQARYGLDPKAKQSGTANTDEVQKDLAEMAQHAKRLAMLKRNLDAEFAAEQSAATPATGPLSFAYGTGSGAKYGTTNGPSGIGPRLRWQQPYDEERAYSFRRWPVLAGFDPKKIGKAPSDWENLGVGSTKTKAGPDQLAMISTDIQNKLENIQTVKDHIGNGDLIWDLPIIVNGTKSILGIGNGMIEDFWISEHEQKLAADKALQEKIMLGITLALVAITLIPSGGSSALVIAGAGATVGLAGISAYQLVKEVQEYTLTAAESNTAYDKALAISAEDPSLFKVAVAVVAAGLDIWGATHAFRAIRGLFRSAVLKEAGAVERLIARGDELTPKMGQQLAKEAEAASATGDAAIKTRTAMEADKIGGGVKVVDGHEGFFSGAGKLFRCSPVCAEARYVYDGILKERPDLLSELNRLESGVLDAAEVLGREEAARALLNRLQRIKRVQGMTDAKLRKALETVQGTPLMRELELEAEAMRRFGSVERALGPELIGKAAEAPGMLAIDPKAWMAPENFKAFDAVNTTAGKGAKVSSDLVEQTYRGQKIWVVEQRIAGGKWYSIKTLNAPKATKQLVAANVDEAIKKAVDEATFKAASVRDPTPIAGKDVYLRVIKDGPADAIEIIVQIPMKNSGSALELEAAQKWANDALAESLGKWASPGELPLNTTVTVVPKP